MEEALAKSFANHVAPSPNEMARPRNTLFDAFLGGRRVKMSRDTEREAQLEAGWPSISGKRAAMPFEETPSAPPPKRQRESRVLRPKTKKKRKGRGVPTLPFDRATMNTGHPSKAVLKKRSRRWRRKRGL
jgi:hypothetical protein